MGICKLCLKRRNLRDSHLIPKAMFKYVRDANVRAGWKNPDPIAIVKAVTSPTSKQVSHYVLCDKCEDRFNKNGENWMLKQVWKSTSFRLLDRLNVAHPLLPFQGAVSFSGTSVGFDMDKLGYFALSVFWRASVRAWNLPFGGKTTKLNLGSAKRDIRRFLVGKGAVPQDIALIVTVCTDQESKGVIMTPGRRHGNFYGLSGVAEASGRGVKALILVVDDEAPARELLSSYLETAGYAIAVVGSGPEAIERARQLRPSAITLDIMMPGASGFETLSQLKNTP
jgi:hypothetical protein